MLNLTKSCTENEIIFDLKTPQRTGSFEREGQCRFHVAQGRVSSQGEQLPFFNQMLLKTSLMWAPGIRGAGDIKTRGRPKLFSNALSMYLTTMDMFESRVFWSDIYWFFFTDWYLNQGFCYVMLGKAPSLFCSSWPETQTINAPENTCTRWLYNYSQGFATNVSDRDIWLKRKMVLGSLQFYTPVTTCKVSHRVGHGLTNGQNLVSSFFSLWCLRFFLSPWRSLWIFQKSSPFFWKAKSSA